METPSLRVSGHVSSMHRTFIAEDCAADDFGHWAKDEVTGEEGYIDAQISCVWTWDDTECAWQSRPFKGRQVKRRKDDPKGPEGHSLAMNRYKIPNGGQKRTLLGGLRKEKQERLVKRQ